MPRGAGAYVPGMPWPPIPYDAWRTTLETLHRYTQIAGKIQLARTPLANHYWNVALYVTPRGLTTRSMPADPTGERVFAIAFDLVEHRVTIQVSDGQSRRLALAPRSVSDFYEDVMTRLAELGIEVRIDDHPVELLSEAIPLASDVLHKTYDPIMAERFFRVLSHSALVLEEFRARFLGKSSPVHFFWGSFDLALTRFSGRRAPPRQGADAVTRESYSHEVMSGGFWPGDARHPEPAYYAYAVPAPDGFSEATVHPRSAFWHKDLGEFLLPYDAVRNADDSRAMLLEFLQSAYEAAADLGRWDRAALEREVPAPEERRAAPPPLHSPPPTVQ